MMLTKQQLICEPMHGKIHHAENNHCETKLRSVKWFHICYIDPKKIVGSGVSMLDSRFVCMKCMIIIT